MTTKLEAFQERLRRKYGRDHVPSGPARPVFVSTGSLTLDWALVKGGWMAGRIVEIYGPPDSGKTTIVITSLAAQQRRFPGKPVAYIDIEKTFDEDWAKVNGLDLAPDRWQPLPADTSEEASDMARDCCASGLYSAIAVDSIGAMESRKTLEAEAEKETIARNSKVITRMVKALASLAREHGVTVLLVNQPRAVIGTVSRPDQPSGPRALGHASTVRIRARRTRESLSVMDGTGEPLEVARQMAMTVERTKMSATGRTALFYVNMAASQYGPPGINAADEYASLGIQHRIIAPTGEKSSYYVFPGGRKVQGRDAVRQALQDDPALREAVRAALFAPDGGADAG